MIETSISLPLTEAKIWKRNRKQLLKFLTRYLRTRQKVKPTRSSARKYNTNQGVFEIIPVKFTEEEYNMLHFTGATIRVSVSSLIYGLIRLWIKPVRQKHVRCIEINYSCKYTKWTAFFGNIREIMRYKVNFSS